MWRRKFLFQSHPPRVHGATESIGMGCGGDRESGKKRTSKRIADSKTQKTAGTRKKRRIADLNMEIDGKPQKTAGEDEFPDRISDLPDSVIHHIFGFMRCSKSVVRMTVLSRNWKRVFDSYQSFDFDQRWFQKRGESKASKEQRREERERFVEYVWKSFPARLCRLECLDKFRLYAKDVDEDCVEAWVGAAILKQVKELDVRLDRFRDVVLPVQLNQSIYITFLKISGASLNLTAPINMCNLRGISIKEARFLDLKAMKIIEENCPLLEDLRLVHCPELTDLGISNLLKLRRVEVQECKGLKRIEIAAPELHTFWYHAQRRQYCKIELKCSESLRNLTFKNRVMISSDFEDWVSMCPLLEKLELLECKRIEKLRICSLSLKSLTLIQCSKLDEIEVDTPNLNSLHYEGHVIPFPCIITAPRLSEVKFSFKPCPKRSNIKNHNFFWNFEGCQRYKFVVYTKKTMKIFEDASETDLFLSSVDSKDSDIFLSSECKLEMTSSSSRIVKIVDDWLRERYGKTLELASSKGELLELLNTLLIHRELNPNCCGFYSYKCWRHYMALVVTSSDLMKTFYGFIWQSGHRLLFIGIQPPLKKSPQSNLKRHH